MITKTYILLREGTISFLLYHGDVPQGVRRKYKIGAKVHYCSLAEFNAAKAP